MKTLALETRKIAFVQHFLSLTKDSSITKFEELLREERLKQYETEMKKPMTLKKFNAMIDRAEDDDLNGRMVPARKLLKKRS